LGVGAGILCETAHVFTKALSLAESGAMPAIFSTGAFQQFSPAYIADHAVAIGMWLVLYTVEAAAIMSVMRSNPDKPFQELGTQLSGLATLPRKIFPQAWTPVKEALTHTLAKSAAVAANDTAIPSSDAVAGAVLSAAVAGDIAQAQGIAAAAPQQLVAAPTGLSKELEKTLDDIEAAAAGRAKTPEGPIKPKEHLRKQRAPKLPQAPEEESAKDKRNRRDRELRERKRYLKNFWYAAALSEKVKDKPIGVDILGTRLTLFRDESGKVVAVDDTCPHRGAPLSEGWTATDQKSGKKCVVCPYHGWAFDAEGKLRDVPSAERGSWPKRPIIGSYDVEERGGFVWLFYGSKSLPKEERPPIPTTPELEDGKWRAVYGEIEFNAGHWGVFENAIDMAHIHYLHADSFGNSEKPKVMEMKSTRDTWETSCSFRIHNKPMNKMWEWTSVPSVPVTAKAMLPSTSAVHIELAHGVKMITFVNTVPISENRAINRFCLIRNFALNPAFDFMARDNMYKILGEDKVMVDRLAPERLAVEYSLAPDMPQIAFRQLRQEWIDMGYGVPTESEVPRRGLLPEEC
jgi:phenylpropionate dioxygenase-like ring-hydroxylating dioxygenase large terminal subunit